MLINKKDVNFKNTLQNSHSTFWTVVCRAHDSKEIYCSLGTLHCLFVYSAAATLWLTASQSRWSEEQQVGGEMRARCPLSGEPGSKNSERGFWVTWFKWAAVPFTSFRTRHFGQNSRQRPLGWLVPWLPELWKRCQELATTTNALIHILSGP